MSRVYLVWLCSLALLLSCGAAQNTTSVSQPSQARVGWQAGPTQRGTLTIVWSCVATIITCTWSILHLNVPNRKTALGREGCAKSSGCVLPFCFRNSSSRKRSASLKMRSMIPLRCRKLKRSWVGRLNLEKAAEPCTGSSTFSIRRSDQPWRNFSLHNPETSKSYKLPKR